MASVRQAERKRVKPIKSNVANSFNGRDLNLPIYLEGYRPSGQESLAAGRLTDDP